MRTSWTDQMKISVFGTTDIQSLNQQNADIKKSCAEDMFTLIAMLDRYFSYTLHKHGNAYGYEATVFNGYGLSVVFAGSPREIIKKLLAVKEEDFK